LYLDTAFQFLFKMISVHSKRTQQLPFTGHLRSPEPAMPWGFSETPEFQKPSTLPLVHKMLPIHRMTQMYKKKGCLIIFCNRWLLDRQNTLTHFCNHQTASDSQQWACVKCYLLIKKPQQKNVRGWTLPAFSVRNKEQDAGAAEACAPPYRGQAACPCSETWCSHHSLILQINKVVWSYLTFRNKTNKKGRRQNFLSDAVFPGKSTSQSASLSNEE